MRSWKPKVLTATLLLVSLLPFSVGFSQQRDDRNDRQSQNNRDDHGNRNDNARQHSDFNRGLRDGGRGGQYYDPRHEYDGYDQRYRQNNDYYRQQQGGIGPGQGALIGGAGGAILGATFGRGLKGTIIGGAAGAGIGAVVGEANQNNRGRDDYNHR